MSKGSDKHNEFRRYRQALAALYIGTIAVGFLLLAASVVKQLFFRPVTQLDGQLSAEDPAPADLLRCHDDVLSLYNALAEEVSVLIKAPTSGEPPELGRQWQEFSRGWEESWREVNAWCRFEELSGTNLGAAYNRMAQVHADLQPMQLKYQGLLVRFDEEQSTELAAMRRALEVSRQAIEALSRDSQEGGSAARSGQTQ